jgi:CheY-like chemotaxis protein
MEDHQTILIVEDSPVNRKILSELLKKQGYNILNADSGEEALDLVGKVLPDLIILDILLPGMNGYTTCRQLKEEEETRDIPVIFISSLDATEDKIGGFEVGGVDYITKPFRPAEVMARICTHLRIRHLQRSLADKNKQLEEEKQKSEALLRNVLPRRVACELLTTGTCMPQLFAEATVCFADIVNFTAASSLLSPEIIIRELNEIFTGFDLISIKYNCERMKTIGDAYLFACGIPEADPRHAENIACSALEMIEFLHNRNKTADHNWQIRVGVHSGPVVGGVVGTEKYLYDIFGDTVNIAARMEELGSPMRVNVSSASHALLKNKFLFTQSKEVEMKGKGKQMMYTLTGKQGHV